MVSWLWQILSLQQHMEKTLRGLPEPTVAKSERGWPNSLSSIHRRRRYDGHFVVQWGENLSRSVMWHRKSNSLTTAHGHRLVSVNINRLSKLQSLVICKLVQQSAPNDRAGTVPNVPLPSERRQISFIGQRIIPISTPRCPQPLAATFQIQRKHTGGLI